MRQYLTSYRQLEALGGRARWKEQEITRGMDIEKRARKRVGDRESAKGEIETDREADISDISPTRWFLGPMRTWGLTATGRAKVIRT